MRCVSIWVKASSFSSDIHTRVLIEVASLGDTVVDGGVTVEEVAVGTVVLTGRRRLIPEVQSCALLN